MLIEIPYESQRIHLFPNKLTFQSHFFYYFLVLIVSTPYVLERILIKTAQPLLLAFKACSSILLIYVTNWALFQFLEMKNVASIYYIPLRGGGSPATSLCFGALFMQSLFILFFESYLTKKVTQERRSALKQKIPTFIKKIIY